MSVSFFDEEDKGVEWQVLDFAWHDRHSQFLHVFEIACIDFNDDAISATTLTAIWMTVAGAVAVM